MQNSPLDDSYKLDSAAEIAARLVANRETRDAAEEAPSAPTYVRFRAPATPASATPVATPEDMPFNWEPEMAGPAGWHVLLSRTQQAVHATGAFVVDPQGLVIACVGHVPGDGAEAVGSRLAFAFEQADRMGEVGTRSQAITIELGDHFLSGLRIAVCDEVRLVVGVCGNQPLSSETLRTLARVFIRKAMGA